VIYTQGIRREEIETMLRAHVIRLTGLPANNVFFSEYAVDTAACPRPCVSMTLEPTGVQQREAAIFNVDSLELWRIVVTASADGPYSVSIDGVVYTHNAVGQTSTQIRNSLLSAINAGAHPDFVATTAASISIDIRSQVPGLHLLVEAITTNVDALMLQGNGLEITMGFVSLPLLIDCVGAYSNPPTVRSTGVDISERLMYALINQRETEDMREAGHCIVNVSSADQRNIVDGEAETIGQIRATLNTTSYNIATVGIATQAPFAFTPTLTP